MGIREKEDILFSISYTNNANLSLCCTICLLIIAINFTSWKKMWMMDDFSRRTFKRIKAYDILKPSPSVGLIRTFGPYHYSLLQSPAPQGDSFFQRSLCQGGQADGRTSHDIQAVAAATYAPASHHRNRPGFCQPCHHQWKSALLTRQSLCGHRSRQLGQYASLQWKRSLFSASTLPIQKYRQGL